MLTGVGRCSFFEKELLTRSECKKLELPGRGLWATFIVLAQKKKKGIIWDVFRIETIMTSTYTQKHTDTHQKKKERRKGNLFLWFQQIEFLKYVAVAKKK